MTHLRLTLTQPRLTSDSPCFTLTPCTLIHLDSPRTQLRLTSVSPLTHLDFRPSSPPPRPRQWPQFDLPTPPRMNTNLNYIVHNRLQPIPSKNLPNANHSSLLKWESMRELLHQILWWQERHGWQGQHPWMSALHGSNVAGDNRIFLYVYRSRYARGQA